MKISFRQLGLHSAAVCCGLLLMSGSWATAQQTPAAGADAAAQVEADANTQDVAGENATSDQAAETTADAQAGAEARSQETQAGASAQAEVHSGQAKQQQDQAKQQQDQAKRQQDQAQNRNRNQQNRAQNQRDQATQAGQQQRQSAGQDQQRMQSDLGVQLQAEGESIIVSDVTAGSVLATAGLQASDEIVAVGGRRFDNPRQMQVYLRQQSGEVPIVILRNGQRQTINVQMGDAYAGQSSPSDRQFGQGQAPPGLGVTFDGSRRDTVIIRVADRSPAQEAGLQEGDVIRSVNGEQHDGPFATALAIHRSRPGQQLTLSVDRNGQQQEIQATLDTWHEAFAQADFDPIPPQVAMRRMQNQQNWQRQSQQGMTSGDSQLAQQEDDSETTVLRPDIDQSQREGQNQQNLEAQGTVETQGSLEAQGNIEAQGNVQGDAATQQPTLDDQKNQSPQNQDAPAPPAAPQGV